MFQTTSMKANSMKSDQQPNLGLIRHVKETLIFCIVSALDVVMTFQLLNRDDIAFIESNPFAGYFLDHWGLEGMAFFKGTMTIIACVITQFVARKDPVLAKQFLIVATLIIVGVVIYSVSLHFNH
jgi:hypothetical protein